MEKKIFLEKTQPYLIHNELDTYCNFLKEYCTEQDFVNNIIAQQTRFHTNEKQLAQKEQTKEDYLVELTLIRKALNDLSNDLPEHSEKEMTIAPYPTSAKSNIFVRFFKNIETGDWNWYNIIMLIIAIAGLYFAYISYIKSNETTSSPATQIKNDTLQSAFPAKYLKDSLYVLVTRFENFIDKKEAECVGKAILLRVKNLRDSAHLPIRAYYAENVYSPDGEVEADNLRDAHHADLIIYGRIKNMKQDCGIGDLCFKTEPSDSIIKATGGQLKKNDLEYQKGISAEGIEMGEISIKGKRFDDWLAASFNAKVGRYNPNWYQISANLPKEELVKEYKIREELFYQNGDFNASIKDCDKIIEISPKDAATHNNRGVAKYNLKQYELAIKDYDKAIEINPKYVETYSNRGTAKWGLQQYELAIKDYDKAIEINPKYAEAYNNRGISKSELKKYELAIKDYDKAIEINPKYVDTYINRGAAKLGLQQYESAIKDCNKAIEMNPKDAAAYNNRGASKWGLQQYESAIKDCDKAIEINPKYVEAYSNRGAAKWGLQQYESAIKDYDKAIEINPKDINAYIKRGITKNDLKQYGLAIKDYDKAIEINPKDADAYINRGVAKNHLMQYKLAIKDYDKAIEINPKYVEAYSNRGAAKWGLQQYESAIKDYDKAIEINPKYAKAYNNRGNAQLALKQYKLAIKDYDKAIEINPNSADDYNNRGVAKENLKQYESAIKDYDKALTLNPNDENVVNNKALILKEMQGKKDNSSIYLGIIIGLLAISSLGYFLYKLKRK